MTRILLTQLTIFSILVLGISSFAFPDFEQSRKINNPFKWKESHKGLDCITEVIRTFNLGDQLKVKRDLKNVETEIVEEGITHSLDVETVLLEYFQWPAQQRSQILQCNLNMKGPLDRCKEVYGSEQSHPEQGNCELIFEEFKDENLSNSSIKTETNLDNIEDPRLGNRVPFVTRKCPTDYKRYGCCKCVRTCKSVNMHPQDKNGNLKPDEEDRNLYCSKPESYKSKRYTDANNCPPEGCEVYADQFFVSKCKPGFTRVGADLCMAVCPHGWPDLGEQCLKVGSVEVIPFPWMVGDDEYEAEAAPSRGLQAEQGQKSNSWMNRSKYMARD